MGIKTITDLKQDTSNPNKGNKKGRALIKESISKFGAGRSILVDKNGIVIAGNNVHSAAMEAGLDVKIIKTTGDQLVVVQRTDIDINSPEGRELSLADNVAAKTNITWDKNVLKKEFKEAELKQWGLKATGTFIKSTPISWMPTLRYKSSNEYEVPDLLLEHAATSGITDPFVPWGTQKRGSSAGSIHFYVDDYRFQTIWDNPAQVISSGCVAIVEPNLSTDNYMPMAYGAFLVFKKRWFARFMQEQGINVYVDAHVADKFREINFLGVPAGWTSFATRGYADDISGLLKDIQSAKDFTGGSINMIVYGGGKGVEKVAIEEGCTYLKPFTSKHQDNGQGQN